MNSPFHITTSEQIDPESYQLRDSARPVALREVHADKSWLSEAYRDLGRGHLDAAELTCFWQMEQYGPSAECLHILGTIAVRRGQYHRALRRMESAVRLAPRDGIIRAHYAETLRQSGDVSKAVAEGRDAVALAPQDGETHNCLGLAFLDNKQPDLALRAFENATKLTPTNAGYWNNLGSTLRTLDRIPEAIENYKQAIRLGPVNAVFHANLAGSLVEDFQHAEAIVYYTKSLELQPHDSETMNHLGQIYDELGQPEQSLKWFRKAIAVNPDAVPAYVNLAIHHESQITQDDRDSIDRILKTVSMSGKQEGALRFAKAHLLDREKDYAAATQEFRRANLAQKLWHESQGEGYSTEKHERFVDGILQSFTPSFMQSKTGWGSQSERPVFIIGLPRSGTTLTEQILAAHPEIHGAGELRLASRTFESLPSRLKLQVPAPQCLSQITQQMVETFAEEHLSELQRYNSKTQRVIDMMPENYMYLGWLAVLFPKARFIYCTRDPRDIALSCLITSFKAVKWSNDDNYLIHRFEQHHRLMDHWNLLLPGRILSVSYEDTLADCELQTRRMLDWIGLPWDDACLDHTLTQGIVRTASVSQARQPLYQTSKARWKHYEPYLKELFQRVHQLREIV